MHWVKKPSFAWEGPSFFLAPLFACGGHPAIISSTIKHQVNTARHPLERGSPFSLQFQEHSCPLCHGVKVKTVTFLKEGQSFLNHRYIRSSASGFKQTQGSLQDNKGLHFFREGGLEQVILP